MKNLIRRYQREEIIKWINYIRDLREKKMTIPEIKALLLAAQSLF